MLEKSFNLNEFLPNFLVFNLGFWRDIDEVELNSVLKLLLLRFEHLLRPLNGVFLVPQKPFYLKNEADVLIRINSVPGAVLLGLELFKLCLPITKNVLLQSCDAAHLADGVVKLLDGDVLHSANVGVFVLILNMNARRASEIGKRAKNQHENCISVMNYLSFYVEGIVPL